MKAMARPKKIHILLKSTRDESSWLAEAQDGSGISAQHYLPATALLVIGERLREHHGSGVELVHAYELPAHLREEVDQLLALEQHVQAIATEIPARRLQVAEKLAKRNIKQNEIAGIMQLSQGYLASIIKRGATDGIAKFRVRRRPAS